MFVRVGGPFAPCTPALANNESMNSLVYSWTRKLIDPVTAMGFYILVW